MITQVSTSLYRGPRPDVATLAELQNLGVKTILSLESGWFEFFHGGVYSEDEFAERLGFQLRHEPMSDFTAPTADQVRRALTIIREWNGQPVYIHCAKGVDRTGFVCAAYRVMVQQWDVEKAIEEWKAMGFHSKWYFWWIGAFRGLVGGSK